MGSITSNEMDCMIDELLHDNSTFYSYLILGQQVYNTLLYNYIFSFVCQDSKHCGRLVRCLPKEILLASYVKQFIGNKVWDSENYGINQKIRVSFAALGFSYRKFGFDKTFSEFQSAIANDVSAFLELPIENYTHLLESYAWNYHHIAVKYSVNIDKKFADNDIMYRASTFFQGKKYAGCGWSKKDAIEKVARHIVHNVIGADELTTVATSQNYLPIIKHPFQLDTIDYYEKDKAMLDFCKTYGVDWLLARFSLLARSQMGKGVWENLNIKTPDFVADTKPSLLKRSLINWGQEILLLQVFDHQLDAGKIALLDLLSFDITSINIGSDEVHDRLLKILRIDDFSEFLFENIHAPISITLTPKDKKQLGANFAAAFYLSNFSPDKKFKQFFSSLLFEFFTAYGLDLENDYRYALIAFFSAFNIRIESNNHESENGFYHAEIRIGKSLTAPTFICENESMGFAKKNVWQKGYENTVLSFQKFLTVTEETMNREIFLFLANEIKKSTVTNPDFYRQFGVLNANNINQIGLEETKKIIEKIRQYFENDLDCFELMQTIGKINCNKYILENNKLYKYSDALTSQFIFTKISSKGCPCTSKTVVELYPNIINPSESIQQTLIDVDYKLARRVSPITDKIARYALDRSLDAYNYLSTISDETRLYFEKLSTQAETFEAANLGQISSNLDDKISFLILDSHKSVSKQLENLIANLQIQRAVFACGYCFASGLRLLKDIIDRTVYTDVPVEFYVGALQNYSSSSPDNLITGIDKATISMLKEFLNYHNFSLYTCADRFYHGKLYLLEGADKTVICLGSSNISRSAFVSNYELNIALIVDSDSEIKQKFDLWIQQLRYYSTQLLDLDEAMFGNNEIKQDGSVIIKQVSRSIIQRRINELTNAEVQYRLNLWMSHSPDVIAEDLGVLALPNYIVFVYQKRKLMVLESFSAGNAYFCIKYDDSFEDVINNVATFSKTEIFEYSQMAKRGYHISNKFSLENNIRRYFL